MQIETILQIQNLVYPFQDNVRNARMVKVEDIQSFSNLTELIEKKSEMQKKIKLIESPYLIKLLNIYQQDLYLHYLYEYVPYSISKYMQQNYKTQKLQIVEISEKLFMKKMSYELTLLISYLAKMKIEVDLSIYNLGITEDQKLKLYMNARCKMGHKTQLSLVAFYGQCKDKILNHIENEFAIIKKKSVIPKNFVIRGNRLVFPTINLSESIYQESQQSAIFTNQDRQTNFYNSSTQQSNVINQDQKYASICINHNNNPNMTNKNPNIQVNLRQTQPPNFNRIVNFSQTTNKKNIQQKNKKYHRGSFQFGTNKQGNFENYSNLNKSYEDDNSGVKSYNHSKSIRIQMEKKIDSSEKKRKKSSFLVKIITSHEYELDDCNPQKMFGKNPYNQDDIFEHFAKQAQRQEIHNFYFQENGEDMFNNMHNQQQVYDFIPAEPPISPIYSKIQRRQCQPGIAFIPMGTKDIQEKIRMAKEKAEKVLGKYLQTKKKAYTFNT